MQVGFLGVNARMFVWMQFAYNWISSYMEKVDDQRGRSGSRELFPSSQLLKID
jgi:hypothetical protein